MEVLKEVYKFKAPTCWKQVVPVMRMYFTIHYIISTLLLVLLFKILMVSSIFKNLRT